MCVKTALEKVCSRFHKEETTQSTAVMDSVVFQTETVTSEDFDCPSLTKSAKIYKTDSIDDFLIKQ